MSADVLEHDWFPRPLPDNVVLGARSWLYSSFAFVHCRSNRDPGVAVGHDTGLYAGTFFDLGPNGQVDIGNFCTLVGVIFSTNRRMTIGDYVFMAHEVVLADVAGAMPGMQAERSVEEDRTITIENDAWIGAGAVLLGGAHIGEGSVVGAAAVVDFDVPPFVVVAGNPARVVRSIDERVERPQGNTR